MYTLQFNLQQRAAVSAAISFWEKKYIKDRVREIFADRQKTTDEGRDEWQRLVKTVIEESSKSGLPSKLEGELVHIIQEIGKKIYNWFFHIYYNHFYSICDHDRYHYGPEPPAIDYGEKMYWTSYGTIDEVKILKSFWLSNPSLNIIKVYNITCSYALEESINDLWQKIPKNLQERFYDDIYESTDSNSRHIVAYWECCRNGDPHRLRRFLNMARTGYRNHDMYKRIYVSNNSVEANMLRLSTHKAYSTAVQYFWDKLDEEERNKNILWCTYTSIAFYCGSGSMDDSMSTRKEKYIEICIFFMNQMTLDQKQIFFEQSHRYDPCQYSEGTTRVMYRILYMLLSAWPWQELIIPVLNDMWKYLENDIRSINEFLNEITKKMVKNHKLDYAVTNDKYQKIFSEVWYNMPESIKHKIVQENYHLDFMSNLIEIFDVVSIKLIFDDPEIVDIRDKYMKYGVWGCTKLIMNDQYELLDQFIAEYIVASHSEKKAFKQQMNALENFLREGRFDLADKLLDWQTDTPQEKKNLKGRVDHNYLYRYFIEQEQYELGDEFLNWQLEAEEERQKCKDQFKNERFVCDRIENMWFSSGTRSDKAQKRCDHFLNWFSKSKEEIDLFKKQKALISKMIDCLIRYAKRNQFDMIDSFLFWCSLSEEEAQPIKEEIGRSICPDFIKDNAIDKAERYMYWAFTEERSQHNFMNQLILSSEGITACVDFISITSFRLRDGPEERKLKKFKKFIKYWMKPLKVKPLNIDEFRIKMASQGLRMNLKSEEDSRAMFINLLNI